ncbi:MAG: hypothetical protein GF384_00875, partial [Elusimicrobia bacterium]|nr:hypothetical protein [Elusimicrobiota bacterium]
INALRVTADDVDFFNSSKPVNVSMETAPGDKGYNVSVTIENRTSDTAQVGFVSDTPVSIVLSPRQKRSFVYDMAEGVIKGDPVEGDTEELEESADTVIPEAWDLKTYNNIIDHSRSSRALVQLDVKEDAHVNVIVYASNSKEIITLVDEPRTAGIYRIYWDGNDFSGSPVGSGIYFVHMQSGGFSETRKIAVVK